MGKNPPANAADVTDMDGFDPWVGEMPWRRAQQTTLVFLPGEYDGQRILAGPRPWVAKSWTQLNNI